MWSTPDPVNVRADVAGRRQVKNGGGDDDDDNLNREVPRSSSSTFFFCFKIELTQSDFSEEGLYNILKRFTF